MAERTRNHDEIRRWAEQRGGHPAYVEGTEILRIDFDDAEADDRLQRTDWDEFFQTFDDRGLDFLYEPDAENRFNKFVGNA